MHRYILHNAGLQEASAALLSAGQVGLLSGWGVFSTLRVASGVLFAFERHFERMRHDATLLRVPFPAEAQAVRRALLRLVEANQAPEATLRVVVVRNRGGIWEGPEQSRDYDLIALTTGLKDWGAGVRLTLRPQGRHAGSPFHGVKMLSWGLNLAMLEDAQCRGYDEVILLNERGEVSECTSANIFAVRKGEALTPPLASGCLPGVTRDLLLRELRVEGVSVREQTLYPEDLARADELFITSTTRNLLPVLSIDGRPTGAGKLWRLLGAAFDRYVEAYVAEALKIPLCH